MRRRMIFLGLLLLAQLGLAFGLKMERQDLGAYNGSGPLLAISEDAPDMLVFSGPDKAEIKLQKVDGQWQLPETFGTPADKQKIADLLHRLTTIRRPWPTADGDDVADRFKVSATDYERRLQFFQGKKKLATLLLGSSPGFRKVHARVEGEKKIYDIPFSTYKVSLKADAWIDRRQLQVEREKISSINLPDCRIVRKDKVFQVEGLDSGEQTDRQKVDALVAKVTGLQVLDVIDKPQKPLSGSGILNLTVNFVDGRKRSYQLRKGDHQDVLLQVSDRPYLYKVRSGLLTELQGYQRAQLVKMNPQSPPSTSDGGNSGAS